MITDDVARSVQCIKCIVIFFGIRADERRDQYNVIRLCQILSFSRSGHCQWRVRPPSTRAQANAALDAELAAIHRPSRAAMAVRTSCGNGESRVDR